MSNIDHALEYVGKHGFSVIPVGPDKKPLFEWKEFQKRMPTKNEIEEWWDEKPQANVAIVTGQVSNLLVVDVDTNEGKQNISKYVSNGFKAPKVQTPRGGYHLYFRYYEGIHNKTKMMPGVDIRAEGGYVVAPPSVNAEGKQYEWAFPLEESTIPDLPPACLTLLDPRWPAGGGELSIPNKNNNLLIYGSRNDDLFTLALRLFKGSMEYALVLAYAYRIGNLISLPDKEIETIVKSAEARAKRAERNLAKEVRDWISVSSGEFSVSFCYQELAVVSKEDKASVRTEISNLYKTGIIEPNSKKNGVWRRVESDIIPIDFLKAPTQSIDIDFPLEEHRFIKIYPKNIGIICGTKDAGKTGWCLNFIKQNMNKPGFPKILYATSELSDTELRIRLELHDDIKLSDWKFEPIERSSNFQDVVLPDGVNIFDFLGGEFIDEAWKIGKALQLIHSKLKKGIAIICLQKRPGKELAVGGGYTLDLARFYITLESGQARIHSAKSFRGEHSPVGLVRKYKLIKGWKFIPQTDWCHPEDDEIALRAMNSAK